MKENKIEKIKKNKGKTTERKKNQFYLLTSSNHCQISTC